MNNFLKYIFSNKIFWKKFAIYALGSYLISFGIPFLVGAKVGLSGADSYITSVCRSLNMNPQSKEYGYIIWVHYTILWIAIMFIYILKKKFKREKITKKNIIYILSMVVPVFSTGPLVSLNNLWVPSLIKSFGDAIWTRYILFIFGMLISSFGASFTVWTKMLIEPHSAIVLETNEILGLKIFLARISLDMIFFILAVSIGYGSNQNVFEFNIKKIGNLDSMHAPLISYATIIFVLLNGTIFGIALKFSKKILGDN